MSENWKPVVGYEDLYEVSDLGRVRSHDRVVVEKTGMRRRHRGRVLKPGRSRVGYYTVYLCRDGVGRSRTVHSLVAEAFLGPAPGEVGTRRGCYQVNHASGDKTDNSAGNLEWLLKRENVEHAAETGLTARGDRLPQTKLTERQAGEVKWLLAETDLSQSAIARRYGVSRGCVRGIYRGANWKRVAPQRPEQR